MEDLSCDPQSIVRLLSPWKSDKSVETLEKELIGMRYWFARAQFFLDSWRRETLRSYISYENSTRTDERTSRIHSAILIMRFLVLSGMRKLTFLRIMCESWCKSYDAHRDIYYFRLYVREVEFGRDSALGMQRVQKLAGEFQSTRRTT